MPIAMNGVPIFQLTDLNKPLSNWQARKRDWGFPWKFVNCEGLIVDMPGTKYGKDKGEKPVRVPRIWEFNLLDQPPEPEPSGMWKVVDYSASTYQQEHHPLCKSAARSMRHLPTDQPQHTEAIKSELPAATEQEQEQGQQPSTEAQQSRADHASTEDQLEISAAAGNWAAAQVQAAGGDSFSTTPEQLRKASSRSVTGLQRLRVNSKTSDQSAAQAEAAC